jgi:hypothetical protein
MPATKYILIHEDGMLERKTIDNVDGLQEAVQGLIATVPVMSDKYIPGDTTVFANDEGLLIGMLRNRIAEEVTGYPMLTGPVLIGGAVDEEGETLSITPEITNGIIDASTEVLRLEKIRYAL